jgi:inorganic pyrophosphatase
MSTNYLTWRPHPWHGLDIRRPEDPEDVVNAFIEITPFDHIKYEVCKQTGYLRVDRPQRTSTLPPSLYGFVPRTYCGDRTRDLMPGAACGDADPLDICVLSERPIERAEVILPARVIGGLPMLDDGEADDKIIAVLANDDVWGQIRSITDLPRPMTSRLRHYFSTYKTLVGEQSSVAVGEPYDRDHALQVIRASAEDYRDQFPG